MLRIHLPRGLREFGLHDRRKPRAFAHDRSGAVTITVALTLSALVGFAALATEVAGWYLTKRTMQGAADSAAYSAAMAKAAGYSIAAYTSEAKSVVGSYGYIDGSNGFTVTVNSPPSSGTHTTDNSAVEVIITRSQPLALAGLFLRSPPTLAARAVATAGGATGCVLALDESDVTDVSDNGNTTLNLNHCNIYVNSPATNALRLVGGAVINAHAAYISGNYTTTGQSALNTTAGIRTGVTPASDPYANVSIPSYSGCNQNNYSLTGHGSQSFSPGVSGVWVFCGGLSIMGNSSVTLQSGTYVIDGGRLTVEGGSSLTSTGPVTLVFTSSSGANYATASIAGGATIDITAPTSGPLSGLAFFQDRSAPSSGSDSFAGGATQNVTGAIYFPNQNVTFAGGTETGGAKCTQLVALTLTFNGNANFNNDCPGVGVRGIGTALVQLVE
jgi:Flp pilus assembly protein TadG